MNSSVADPHWFQCGSGFGILDHCGSGPGSGSGSRVLITQKFKKLPLPGTDGKNYIFLTKIAIYLSLDPKRTPKSLEKPSTLKTFHNMKFLQFFHFCGLWVNFTLPDPNQVDQSQCGSGSATPMKIVKNDRVFFCGYLLCNVLVLVVGVGSRPGGLPLDDGNLHVFYLDPHQQEVDLSHNHVLDKSINEIKISRKKSHKSTKVP
jgi:hypothetical protein